MELFLGDSPCMPVSGAVTVYVNKRWEGGQQGSKSLIHEIIVGTRGGRPLVWSGPIKESDRDSSYILPMALAKGDSDWRSVFS